MKPMTIDPPFNDDRMFVLEISRATTRNLFSTDPEKQVWAVYTSRNGPGYPPHRVDDFPTEDEAVDFYREAVVTTPRVSLGRKSPEPIPSLEQYASWLIAENLLDPLLNPTAPRPDAQPAKHLNFEC